METTTVNDPATRKFKVLVVDDHPIVRHGLGELIARQPDLEFGGEATEIAEALREVELDKAALKELVEGKW